MAQDNSDIKRYSVKRSDDPDSDWEFEILDATFVDDDGPVPIMLVIAEPHANHIVKLLNANPTPE